MAHEQGKRERHKRGRQQGDRAISRWRASLTNARARSINNITHANSTQKRERLGWASATRARARRAADTSNKQQRAATASIDLERKKVFERGRCSLPHSFALSHERTNEPSTRTRSSQDDDDDNKSASTSSSLAEQDLALADERHHRAWTNSNHSGCLLCFTSNDLIQARACLLHGFIRSERQRLREWLRVYHARL